MRAGAVVLFFFVTFCVLAQSPEAATVLTPTASTYRAPDSTRVVATLKQGDQVIVDMAMVMYRRGVVFCSFDQGRLVGVHRVLQAETPGSED